MKAKYLGFCLGSSSATLPVSKLISFSESISSTPVENTDFDRYYLFDDSTNSQYFLGMVLTLKSQRKMCRANIKQGGSIKIKTKDLANNDKLLDFNFFAINKVSLKGMYVYYHHSCSILSLGDRLRKIFYSRKNELIDAEVEFLRSENPQKSDTWYNSKAAKKHKGRFEFSRLVDKREIDKVLAEFTKIKNIEVAFSAVDSILPSDGVALQNKSNIITTKFSISAQEDVNEIAQAAKSLVGMNGFRRGKAKIVDDQDIERTIRLIHAPENFGEEDFDVLADKVDDLDTKVFQDNKILTDIIGVMENVQNKSIFSSKS